jgi:hypothetical protein
MESIDPEILDLVKAITTIETFDALKKDLDEFYDELSTESEELIESPNSNSPEILVKRKEIAEQINEILEIQDELKPLMLKNELSKSILQSASEENMEKARILINSIHTEINTALNSDPTLN